MSQCSLINQFNVILALLALVYSLSTDSIDGWHHGMEGFCFTATAQTMQRWLHLHMNQLELGRFICTHQFVKLNSKTAF